MSNGMTNTNRSMKDYLLRSVIMVLLILALELCILMCVEVCTGSAGFSWNAAESGIVTADQYASIPGKILLEWM